MVVKPIVLDRSKRYLYRELVVKLEERKYRTKGQSYQVVGVTV